MKRLEIDPEGPPCSFCGVPHPHRHVIVTNAARTRWVCEECIRLCGEILGEELAAVQRPDDPNPIELPAVDAPAFLEQLNCVMRAIDDERAARGMSFLVDASRKVEPEPLVRAPRPVAQCSFCSRPETDVVRLISGKKVYICEGCVLSAAHVHERFKLRQR